MLLLHCIRRRLISLEKKNEQLKPPESCCLEESLMETWKRQLQYSLKLLSASSNKEQLERMKCSTWLYVPSILVQIVRLWPENKDRTLWCILVFHTILQYAFVFNGTLTCHEKAHKAASLQVCCCWCYYRTSQSMALLLPSWVDDNFSGSVANVVVIQTFLKHCGTWTRLSSICVIALIDNIR